MHFCSNSLQYCVLLHCPLGFWALQGRVFSCLGFGVFWYLKLCSRGWQGNTWYKVQDRSIAPSRTRESCFGICIKRRSKSGTGPNKAWKVQDRCIGDWWILNWGGICGRSGDMCDGPSHEGCLWYWPLSRAGCLTRLSLHNTRTHGSHCL